MSPYRRVVAINAGGLVFAALILALSPATVSSRMTAPEAVALAAGTVALIAANVGLLRRIFGPLEQDRRASGRRALMAQERERRRLARELHDEVGQTLTGVVLQLEGLHRLAPAELAEPVAQLQETAREGAEEVREIIRGLRPQALDEFGLRSALVSLADGVTERTGVRVRARVGTDLPSLSAEQDLAIYRVKAGASGYVLRTAADRDLVEACRAAMRGEPFLYPATIRSLMRSYVDAPEPALSPRESEVAKLVAEAHTTDQIADVLVISPRTVERHRENIPAELGMRDRVELTRWAIRHGLVEP